ncbi:structural maintenance of chromosomes protein 6 [Trichomonascus vanleenenianus]|uniref:DNA repair protein SMC6 n=1 Tax=Trichomonascus vanleenenianus TaxID=2268995 RepID=UPI003ECA8282
MVVPLARHTSYEDADQGLGKVKRRRVESDEEVDGYEEEDDPTKFTRPGQIMKVELMNFMCHDELSVEFKPRMNFITGANGSGKSTILTAITTCLGGKASATNRGSSLKALIKEGRQTALISITLNNYGGKNAWGEYQPDVYGKQIIIERRISRDGAATFKIKSSLTDKTISTKARDLEEMLETFGILIDNPLAVLTQDTARSFLTSTRSTDKYDYFKRAVGLDQLEFYVSGTHESLSSSKTKLQYITENFRHKKQEYKDLQKKLDEVREAGEAGNRLNFLEAKLVWNEVTVAESHVERLNAKYAQQEEKIAKAKSQYAGRQEEAVELGKKKSDINEKMQQCHAEKDTLTEGRSEVFRRVTDAKSNFTDAENELKSSLMSAKALDNEMAKVKQELARKQKDEADGRKGQLQREQKKLEEKVENLEEELRDVEDKKNDLQGTIERARREKEEAAVEVQSISRELQGLNQQVKSIHDSQKQKLLAFSDGRGGDIVSFMNEFKRTRFRDSAIGPVGLEVRLLDPKWSYLLETLLKDVLSAFIVFNRDDREILRQLLNKYRIEGSIFLRPKEVFDYTHGKPANVTTVIDSLEIQSKVVELLLVDQAKAESIVLIEDRNEAKKYISSSPANVAFCLTMGSSASGDKSGFRVFNRGSVISNVTIEASNRPPKMTTDSASQLRDLQEEITRLESKKRDAQRILKEKDHAYVSSANEYRELRTRVSQLKSEIQASRNRLEKVTDELLGEDDSEVIQHLHAKMGELKAQQDLLGGQIQSAHDQKEEAQATVREIEKELKQWEEKLSELDRRRGKLRKTIETIDNQLSEISRGQQNHDHNVREMEAVLHLLAQKKDEKLQELASLEIRAEEKSREADSEERLYFESGETVDSINQEIEKCHGMLEQHSGELDFKTLFKKCEECKEAYLKARKSANEAVLFYKKSSGRIDDLKKKIEMIRTNTSTQISTNFTRLISQRGFQGNVTFDHERLEVNIKVATPQSKDKLQNVDKLSGGEKSFTQIALLSAIWQTLETTLYALDEFDVFMDKVNRKVSLKLAIEVLRRLHSQSIFITPQELENSDIDFDAPDIKVVRLDNPERA